MMTDRKCEAALGSWLVPAPLTLMLAHPGASVGSFPVFLFSTAEFAWVLLGFCLDCTPSPHFTVSITFWIQAGLGLPPAPSPPASSHALYQWDTAQHGLSLLALICTFWTCFRCCSPADLPWTVTCAQLPGLYSSHDYLDL